MQNFQNIAKLVKEARRSVGIGQFSLGLKLGVKNGQFVSNIERGLCSIPAKHIKKFCEVTHIAETEVVEAILKDYEMELFGELGLEFKGSMIENLETKIVLSASLKPDFFLPDERRFHSLDPARPFGLKPLAVSWTCIQCQHLNKYTDAVCLYCGKHTGPAVMPQPIVDEHVNA